MKSHRRMTRHRLPIDTRPANLLPAATMDRMTSHQLFKATYPGSKTEQRLNQAIRTEIPGGSPLLDLLELVHKARTRGHIDKPLDFAELIEDRLQDIKEAMAKEVKTRYQLNPIP